VDGGPENDAPEADAIVAAVRQRCGLDVPPPAGSAVPFEEELMPKGRLPEILTAAGIGDLRVTSRRYRHVFEIEEYLSGWGSRGRHLRHVVGDARWSEFVETAASTLRDRFGETISGIDEAWLVTGRRRP
jgi:hypothetical protein